MDPAQCSSALPEQTRADPGGTARALLGDRRNMMPIEASSRTQDPSRAGPQGPTAERFARIDIDGVRVVRCTSPADWETAGMLRAQAFGRLTARRQQSPTSYGLDAIDRAPGTQVLLGHAREGQPIASMRVQCGLDGPLELNAHVPLEDFCQAPMYRLAQFSRLAALRHDEALDVMFALFKAAWRWCLNEGLEQIVIASPPWTRPIYEHLCFEDLGDRGRFRHPLSGRALHTTMRLSVPCAEAIWRARNHPHCALFFEQEHPKLNFRPGSHSTAPRLGGEITRRAS